jgi:hypothetical protein
MRLIFAMLDVYGKDMRHVQEAARMAALDAAFEELAAAQEEP